MAIGNTTQANAPQPAASTSGNRANTPIPGETQAERMQRIVRNDPSFGDKFGRLLDFQAMSQQSQGVIRGANATPTGINAQPSSVTIPQDSVDRTPIGERVSGAANAPQPPAPAFNLAAPTPNVQMPEAAAGGIVAGTTAPAVSGSATNTAVARTAVPVAYGKMFVTADELKKPEIAAMAKLPANSARLESIGEEARKNVASRKMQENAQILNAQRNEQQRQRDAESAVRQARFMEGIKEREAREAFSTERGRSPDRMRGAQALAEAQRWRDRVGGGAAQTQTAANTAGATPQSPQPFIPSNFQLPNVMRSPTTPMASGYLPPLFPTSNTPFNFPIYGAPLT